MYSGLCNVTDSSAANACGSSLPRFSRNMMQSGIIGAMAKTRADISASRPGNLPTYEPCVC